MPGVSAAELLSWIAAGLVLASMSVTDFRTCRRVALASNVAFAAYGLSKGALLSTEAATSLFIYLTKVGTFRSFGAMPLAIFAKGVVVGSSLMLGAFIGKALVRRMDERTFQFLLDGMMLLSGLFLLLAAFR